jgi:5-methylthioadenosine/S-adenosylhomocysteine deaminase
MRRLLKNCSILWGNPLDANIIKNAYLGIDAKTIDYIGQTSPQAPYDETKDMKGCLLLPGLINCHCHAPMVLVRGVGSDLPLQEWLFDKIMPIEGNMKEQDIAAGTYWAMMEMLACGTTSFTDMYDFSWVTAKAAAEAGMKVNLCRPLVCIDPLVEGRDCGRIQEAVDFYNDYNGMADGRVLVDFGIHSEYLSTVKSVEYFSRECKRVAGRIHVHLSETQREHEECKAKYGMTPAAWLNNLGVFDSPTYAAHCVHCEDSDLLLFKEKGVTIVHNPSSNMKLGSGFAPIGKALDMGLNVTVGTDGAASNNNLNLLEEMHLTSILHNGYQQNPTIVKPEQVVAMVTSNAACAQGRKDTGTLLEGKKADITAVSFDAPHMFPALEIMPMLTYSAQASDVKMTMVDGNILYENGEYLTIDAQRAMWEVKAAVRRLLNV